MTETGGLWRNSDEGGDRSAGGGPANGSDCGGTAMRAAVDHQAVGKPMVQKRAHHLIRKQKKD